MKAIITTTIHKPSEATFKFCEIAKKNDWLFIIVGDTKTPHDEYKKLESEYPVMYLTPEYQENKYKTLSDNIGWGCIQRRNIGFVEAYNMGAEIIATIDDDNVPYDDWGQNLYVGQTIDVDYYEPELDVFDPLSVTKNNNLWHRGYPVEYLQKRHNVQYKGKIKRKVLVQADLWDGDPDIDAMARLVFKPAVKYSDITKPYASNAISPFNSQNTFLAREVMPFYFLFPYVGRMDDIWGSYVLQHYFPNSVIYGPASVYHDRNKQSLITNLKNEIIGYEYTLSIIKDLENYEKYLPKESIDFVKIYKEYVKIDKNEK